MTSSVIYALDAFEDAVREHERMLERQLRCSTVQVAIRRHQLKQAIRKLVSTKIRKALRGA